VPLQQPTKTSWTIDIYEICLCYLFQQIYTANVLVVVVTKHMKQHFRCCRSMIIKIFHLHATFLGKSKSLHNGSRADSQLIPRTLAAILELSIVTFLVKVFKVTETIKKPSSTTYGSSSERSTISVGSRHYCFAQIISDFRQVFSTSSSLFGSFLTPISNVGTYVW